MRLEKWHFSRRHFMDFIHSRLWLGVPIVVAIMFAVVVAKNAIWGDKAIDESMVDGLLCGALPAFCWIVGIWAATGPEPEPDEEDEMDAKGELWLDSLPRPWSVSLRVLFILLAISAIFCFEIIDLASGEMSWPEVLSGVLLEAATISCLIIPVWLSESGKS